MAFTFLQFQDHVAHFVRQESRDNVQIDLIKELINIALYEVARATKWPELLKLRVNFGTVGVNTGGKIVLPTDAMMVDRVAFFSFGTEWLLPERSKLVPPARVLGKPRCYNVVQGTAPSPLALFIEPFTAVDDAFDEVFVDYYATPPLLVADADVPLSNMWDTEIIRKAEQLYLIYNKKIPQAQAIISTMDLAKVQTATPQ